jgi:hypothetical protein
MKQRLHLLSDGDSTHLNLRADDYLVCSTIKSTHFTTRTMNTRIKGLSGTMMLESGDAIIAVVSGLMLDVVWRVELESSVR